MTKRIVTILVLATVLLLSVASFILAQDTLDLLDVLTIVRDTYDGAVVQMSYDEDNACWAFELEDGTEGCISDTTGELVDTEGPEATEEPEASEPPEATEEPEASEPPEATEEPGATPTVSVEEAIETALTIFPNGAVSNVNLAEGDETLLWVIRLDDGARTVVVNATTGAVLSFGFTADDDEASEPSAPGVPGEASEPSEPSEPSEASEPSEPSEASEASD